MSPFSIDVTTLDDFSHRQKMKSVSILAALRPTT